MKPITQQQMDNLVMLRGVIENKLGQPDYVLDDWFQPCGTYGCVAGDYFMKANGLKVAKLSVSSNPDFIDLVSNHEKHFGHSLVTLNRRHICVFGTACDGSIEERLDMVTDLIANSYVDKPITDDGETKAKTFMDNINKLAETKLIEYVEM